MTVDQIVGGAVWVQIMVLLAAAVFATFELAFAAMGRRRLFLTRRRLGLATCLSVLMLPVILPVLMAAPFAANLNATDAIVAQYLKGNISVSAMEMNALVDFRTGLVDQLASGHTWLAQILLATFATALLARTVYLGVNVGRIRHAIRSGFLVQRSRRVQVIVSPSVSVPFSTRGLFNYFVVMPQDIYNDPSAFQMSLGHELQHIRQGDVDAEVLLSLASPLVVLNPGFWYMSARLRKLGELACDRAYLARQSFDAHSYSIRLLGIARRNQKQSLCQPSAFGVPLVGRSLPWAGRRSMLKSRILEIAHDLDRPTREHRWVGLTLSLGLALCLSLTAVSMSNAGDWSHERIMLSTVVNLERIENLNTLAQRSW